jgi:hypothetical protein
MSEYIYQRHVAALERELAAMRERHAEAVEAAFKEGRSSDQRAQDDAAWLASEAKKGLDAWARREP